jgi:hypothetical protein
VRATAKALKEDAALRAVVRPPPAEAAPALSAAEKARRLRDLGPAAYLYGAAAPVLGEAMDVEAWQVYLNDLLKRMGVTGADPVARMMAEQLALAHDAVGRLHLRAGTRTSPAEVAAYYASVSRLMTEFRRTSAALKAYTAGAARRKAVAPRTSARGRSGVRPARRAGKAQRGKVASNGNRIKGRVRGRKHAFA